MIIAEAQMKVACTISGASVLGRMWRSMIFGTRVPAATPPRHRAARARLSTTPRTSRATRGTSAMVIAMMTFCTEPRVSAISAIASRIAGDRHQPVHHPHDDRIEPAHEARDQADRKPQHRARRRATAKPTTQRDARAVDHARVDVAAQHVGAEPVSPPTARAAADRRQRGGIDGAEPGREDRHEHHEAEQDAADRRWSDGGGSKRQRPAARVGGGSTSGSAGAAAMLVCGAQADQGRIRRLNSGSSGRTGCRSDRRPG